MNFIYLSFGTFLLDKKTTKRIKKIQLVIAHAYPGTVDFRDHFPAIA